jgi:hypothetical protein
MSIKSSIIAGLTVVALSVFQIADVSAQPTVKHQMDAGVQMIPIDGRRLALRYSCDYDDHRFEGELPLHYCAPHDGFLPSYNTGEAPCESGDTRVSTLPSGEPIFIFMNGALVGRFFEINNLSLFRRALPNSGDEFGSNLWVSGALVRIDSELTLAVHSTGTPFCDFKVVSRR